MLRKYRVRKAGKLFVAENGGGDYVADRGFTHERHIERFAGKVMDAGELRQAVEARGVAVARQFTFRYTRTDGEFREITLSAPDEEIARTMAEQRLGWRYPDQHEYTLTGS